MQPDPGSAPSQDIEARQDRVLAELEHLNRRIEQAIRRFTAASDAPVVGEASA